MQEILKAIVSAGGRPLFVGGCVRDKLMGIESKDIDVEVYNLPADKLVDVLQQFGRVDQVGVSFGVIKLTTETDDFDFTLPRTENKIGAGHKGFQVEVDHMLTPTQAACRRDFTINSIAMDMDDNLIDPFDGAEDICNKVLHATSEHFVEDPLRVLRGFQFAGRFDMDISITTAKMCQELLPEASTIAVERIYMEVVKWALKSVKPSKGLDVLVQTHWIKLFPELDVLVGLNQDPIWHPEGCVYTHTGLVCDAAVDIAVRDGLNDEDRLVLVLAALCHDLGKATTTVIEDGRIRSPGHAQEGLEPTKSLLGRMGFSDKVIEKVIPLVVCHMDHIGVNPNKGFVRRLAHRLYPASIEQLVRLMEADHSGRMPLPKHCPDSALKILEISKELDIQFGKPKPIVMGRHLIDELNMQPGPDFKLILDKCYQLQLDGDISDLESGLKFAKSFETITD